MPNHSPVQPVHHIPAFAPVPEGNTSPPYQLRNGAGATPSSFGTTSSSYNSSDFSPDINGGGQFSASSPHSLPAYAQWQPSQLSPSAFQPSSAPTYTMDEYLLQHSPATTDFYSNMANLGLEKNTVSPRDVMSATVVDGDDFNAASPSAGGGDFSFTFGAGSRFNSGLVSSSYPADPSSQHDFLTNQGYGYTPTSLFGPQSYPLEAEKSLSSHHDSSSHDMVFDSPTSTIRQRRSVPHRRPILMTPLTTGSTPWSINAKAAPTTATSKALFATPNSVGLDVDGLADGEGEVIDDFDTHDHDDENDAALDDDSDDDYIESPAHHSHHPNTSSGAHRTSRRMSHSISSSVPSQGVRPPRGGRTGSPYSRPSGRRMSHGDAPSSSGATGKKVKAVKWESTKPKYWVPEGFDPWWDQKSRGRGVQTVDSTNENVVDESSAWPANFLPDDWKELVRGKSNPSRPFVCPAVNCGKTFQRSEHAKRHAWSLHTPDAGELFRVQ